MALTSISTTSSRRRWSALALVVTAQFMVILDELRSSTSRAAVRVKSDLHFSQSSLQWVVSAYAIFFGGVLLLGGRLADLFGRRRLFITGLALFAASSLLCGISWIRGVADRVSRRPGPRRRLARPGGAVASHDHLHRGP